MLHANRPAERGTASNPVPTPYPLHIVEGPVEALALDEWILEKQLLAAGQVW